MKATVIISFSLQLLLVSSIKSQDSDKWKLGMSNPGCFAGTDFGTFFQRLYINQEYSQMLTFTSQVSRLKFGDERLVEFFKTMEFAYPLKLKSKVIEGETIWLNYLTSFQATRTTVRMPVRAERDTVRVIIQSIDRKFFLRD